MRALVDAVCRLLGAGAEPTELPATGWPALMLAGCADHRRCSADGDAGVVAAPPTQPANGLEIIQTVAGPHAQQASSPAQFVRGDVRDDVVAVCPAGLHELVELIAQPGVLGACNPHLEQIMPDFPLWKIAEPASIFEALARVLTNADADEELREPSGLTTYALLGSTRFTLSAMRNPLDSMRLPPIGQAGTKLRDALKYVVVALVRGVATAHGEHFFPRDGAVRCFRGLSTWPQMAAEVSETLAIPADATEDLREDGPRFVFVAGEEPAYDGPDAVADAVVDMLLEAEKRKNAFASAAVALATELQYEYGDSWVDRFRIEKIGCATRSDRTTPLPAAGASALALLDEARRVAAVVAIVATQEMLGELVYRETRKTEA